MKKENQQKTSFGKINKPDKKNESSEIFAEMRNAELDASAAPDEEKKRAADEKKELPAEEQTNKNERNAETVSKPTSKPSK